jgi:hypothetical protein
VPRWTVVVLAACAAHAATVPSARFANAPPVAIVDDRRDTPATPEVHRDLQNVEFWDMSIQRPIERTFELHRHRRALGTSSIDHVPDSTWFTNRITARALSPDEVRNGPLVIDSPEHHLPMTVLSTKLGGHASAGVIVEDARGVTYMLKFDRREYPEMETGVDVVVDRLLWACGYHVPEDEVIYVRPQDLVLDRHATIKGRLNEPRAPLTRELFDSALATLPRTGDGRIRALASRWLDGKPLGGYPTEGTRAGDPNDRIPHELRRDLRGEYPILAWLDHTEADQSNFLDMYIADPGDPRRHYVEHYQLDFGVALGVKSLERRDLHQGRMFEIDAPKMLASLVTFGAVLPRAEHTAPALTGVAPLFTAEDFDPAGWMTDEPYAPIVEADDYDRFWGATVLERFTPAQIRAAVEAAKFTDPRATAYVTRTLIARRTATLAHWFARVNPLDGFAVEDDRFCFDDLAARAGLARPAGYEITRYTALARAIATTSMAPAATSRTCTRVELAPGETGYTILRIHTLRDAYAGETYVHLARDPATRKSRVIGVWRP